MRAEYGLRVASPADPLPDPRDACPAAWRAFLPDAPVTALYFGTEFCEDRLPDAGEAAAFCALARDRGWQATLLTPLVSPAGLARTGDLLDALSRAGWQPAVVCNDWGVLELLIQRHPSLARRAGRLINRSLRDPRAYADDPAGPATHDASRHAAVRALLRSLGVKAVESDADLEGGYLGDGDFDRALHVPYTFAASGRACPLKAALYPDGGGFTKALADPCTAPCRGGALPVRRDDTALPHWRAGNTVLYELPQQAARAWLKRAERIVVHTRALP